MRILSPTTRVHVVGCHRDTIKFVSVCMTFEQAVQHVLKLCKGDSVLSRVSEKEITDGLNSKEGLHIEDANLVCIPEEIMSRISQMPQRRSATA